MKFSDSFHIMTKPSGAICNMDCTYCFYLQKENLYEGQKDFRMNDEVLESFIKQFIQVQKVPEISFAWQGGEPTLLGVDYFKKVVELQDKYAEGKIIHNAFQTNGVLLDDEWCEFFAESNFLLGISIDGPKEIHDKYRYFKGGQDSFEKVVRGIEFMQKHNVEFNTLTCVNRHNSYKPPEVYKFLKEIGSGFMQFIPIVERVGKSEDEKSVLISPHDNGEANVSDWSVEPLQYGKFLSTIFDEWVRNDVGKYFVQFFDIALEAWLGMEPSLCVFREKCGTAMALEHNGDLYSCDHYVYPENKLGNIVTENLEKLVNSDKQHQFGNGKLVSLPEYCKKCEVRFACNGECPKHRFIETSDGENGLNYLCEGYYHFFNHVDPYMKFMSEQLKIKQPPANVIEWAKEKDEGFPSLDVKRNDVCPCGSGKKYKKCCGKMIKT